MRLLRWGWVALGICDLFQHRDCALHCSLCMVSYAGLRVSSVCCARTQGIVSGARCGDARGGRGNGERAYVTVCTPAPGACARHRQRVLRARTAVVRTPDMDANGLISIHQLEQLPLKHTDTTRAAPIGIPTSHKPRYNPAQDVPHTPLPAPLPALLYRYGPSARARVLSAAQGCVSVARKRLV